MFIIRGYNVFDELVEEEQTDNRCTAGDEEAAMYQKNVGNEDLEVVRTEVAEQ